MPRCMPAAHPVMASRKNDRKKAPAEQSAPQQRGQELLVDGRRNGSFPTERLSAMKRKVLATGVPDRRQLALDSNGRRRTCDLYFEPNRDGDGKVAGLSCVAVDITFPP